jgi:hypothetical protein
VGSASARMTALMGAASIIANSLVYTHSLVNTICCYDFGAAKQKVRRFPAGPFCSATEAT